LFLSAFFSASETALTSLSRLKTNQIIDSERTGADYLKLWRDKPNHVLATILFGCTVAELLASFLTALYATQNFWKSGNIGEMIAFILITTIILIFGEVVPKVFAKHNAEKLAIPVIIALRIFYYFFYPVTELLMFISKTFIMGFGGTHSATGPFVTEEDIEYMINVSDSEGTIEPSKKEMLEKVMDLGDKVVREIMVPRTDMVTIELNSSYGQVQDIVINSRLTRLPVYDSNADNIVGILHSKDLIRSEKSDNIKTDIADIMREPYFVPETKCIDELLKEFQKTKNHMAIVVDEYGGISGLVTIEDILEEIVGEIRDEHDEDEDLIISDREGVLVINAKIDLNTLEKILEIEFPEDNYDTLGGFVVDLMGKIPKTGDRVRYKNFNITVLEASKRKIIKLKIEKDKSHKETEPLEKKEVT